MRAFNAEELNKFEVELRKFQSPWLSRMILGAWLKFGRYVISPLFAILLAGFIIYNTLTNGSDSLFSLFKTIFFIMFGGVIILFLAQQLERLKIRYARKKLGLSLEEWNYLINYFQIERT